MLKISMKICLRVIFCLFLLKVIPGMESSQAWAVFPHANYEKPLVQGDKAPTILRDDDGGDDKKDDGKDDGDGGKNSHNAGLDCLSSGCHFGGKEDLTVAGTIYTAANGTAARPNATITIRDAVGTVVNLTSNSGGNFYQKTKNGVLTPPLTVSAHYGVGTETMGATTTGDCNQASCHSSTASSGSPRRIYVSSDPQILAFAPETAFLGSEVIIFGKNFVSGGTTVTFGGVAATIVSVDTSNPSLNKITARVGAGSTGNISVTTLYGTATKSGFYYENSPATIISFTPSFGVAGDTITITGTGLDNVTSVSFGGTPAASIAHDPVDPKIKLTAVLASGSSGSVAVANVSGTAASATGFTYLLPPTITDFEPKKAGTLEAITITGANFVSGAMSVSFGGLPATVVTVDSPATLKAWTNYGNTGSISVSSRAGTATSSTLFTFIPIVPTLHEWGNILLGVLLLAISGIFFTKKKGNSSPQTQRR